MVLFSRCTRFTAAALLLTSAPALSAQIRASERGSVSQTIDGTKISLDYARPRVRGRDSLFGGVVKWKEVWTPGANWATTFETDKNIQLEGHPVPKGKYSMWMVVEQGDWTLVLDPKFRLFHMNPPDSSAAQVRFPIHPTPGPFTEVLTFSFPGVSVTGATLVMAWGAVQVSMALTVEPSHPLTIAKDVARPYLGTYQFRWTEDADTVKPSRITLTYERNMLMGKWEPAPWPGMSPFLLIRIGDDLFNIANLEHGEVYDVWDEAVEFSATGGKATRFELRSEKDSLDATAVRER